jgi:hypothetical protein
MGVAVTRERLCMKTAAVCLILGGILAFVSRLMHGDLPADDPQAALRFISSRPFYAGVHLGAILGVLVGAGGIVTLAATFKHPFAWMLGRLGAASTLVGAAVFATDFSTDGMSGQELATAWRAASASDQPDIVHAAGTVFTALHGPSLTGIGILWGLSLLLFGWALLREGHPGWLGWTGCAAGAATFVGATALFLRPSLFPGVVVYGLLVSLALLWSVALGIATWMRARRPDAAAGAATTAAADEANS